MAIRCRRQVLRSLARIMAVCAMCLTASQALAAPNPSKASGYGIEVRFAVAEWPPMVTETLKSYGRHAERVTEIFAAMGYEARFDFLSWPLAMELTRRGDYVATFPWLSTPERIDVFHIPDFPVARAMHKGFYKTSRFPYGLEISDFADVLKLDLRPVGIASYWHEEEFTKHGIAADIVANPESAWRFLDAGRADILFEEEEVGWLDLKNLLGEEVAKTYSTTEAVPTSNLFILFSRNHPDGAGLRRAFDEFMASDDGQKMCAPWSICALDRQKPAAANGDAAESDGEAITDGMN